MACCHSSAGWYFVITRAVVLLPGCKIAPSAVVQTRAFFFFLCTPRFAVFGISYFKVRFVCDAGVAKSYFGLERLIHLALFAPKGRLHL